MSTKTTLEVGDLVIVMSGPMHVVARAIEPPERDMIWLDVNVGGVHLPQQYRVGEIEPLPGNIIDRELRLDRHGFCRRCNGYGLSDSRDPVVVGEQPNEATCPECTGSGRVGITLDVTRDGAGNVSAQVEIDTATTAEIPCDVCRSATVPQ